MKKTDKKPIKITETILRDAHQSLIATRMTTEQIILLVGMDKRDICTCREVVYTDFCAG